MMGEENVCPQAWGGLSGVARELRKLAARPPAGIKLLLNDDDLTHLTAVITGPAETPYADGLFRVRLSLSGGYPARPPRAVFETRIFHPNVSPAGEVCVNTLARDWRPALGLGHALLAVRCLLIAPNPDSALNADAAALLRDDYQEYFARAKLYTDIHARSHTHDQSQSGASEVSEASEEGPSAKRERRAAGGGGDKRDKRRILKRL